MSPSDVTPLEGPITQLPTEAAYSAISPEIAALPEEGLDPINLDVVSVVMTVIGSLPELRELRPAIMKELPSFDLARFDKLEQYALALNHSHALHRIATAPSGSMASLAEALTELRDRLFSAALTLAEFRLIDRERLKECKTAIGYRPLVTDVFALVAVFKEQWRNVQGKTPVTPEMLDEAGTRAMELLEGMGLKEQATVGKADVALVRQKAFNLLTDAYEDARRAVLYLRAKAGDADRIAPSLWAGRGGRGPAQESAAPKPSAAAPGVVPQRPVEPAPASVVIDNRAGLPLTTPFTS